MVKFSELGDFIQEYTLRNIENKYRPVAVGRYGIRSRESIYSKELAKDYSKNKIIYKNTLTIGMGSVQIDIGILSEDYKYSVSPAYHTYEIKGINADYLRYCLECRNADMFKRFVKRGSRQGKTIDIKRWLTYQIPVYDVSEQAEIVSKLDYLKNLIAKRELQLNKIDDLVKSQFIEMFGRETEQVPLSHYITTLEAGKSLAGEEENPNKVLKTGAVSYDYFDGTQVKNLPLDYSPLLEHKVNDGDILISRMNTSELVGAAAYVWRAPENTYIPDRLWHVKCKDCNPIFLWQLLIQPSTKRNIRRIASGTSGSMKNISKQGLLGIKVLCVKREKQNQFARFVEQTDKSKIPYETEVAA